jgi:hypothetical protein
LQDIVKQKSFKVGTQKLFLLLFVSRLAVNEIPFLEGILRKFSPLTFIIARLTYRATTSSFYECIEGVTSRRRLHSIEILEQLVRHPYLSTGIAVLTRIAVSVGIAVLTGVCEKFDHFPKGGRSAFGTPLGSLC